MGIRSFFRPTRGKIALSAVLIPVGIYLSTTWYGYVFGYWLFDGIKIILSLGYYMGVKYITSGFLLLIIKAVYLYILVCIYVTAYNWLNRMLRRKYPGINTMWQQKQSKKK